MWKMKKPEADIEWRRQTTKNDRTKKHKSEIKPNTEAKKRKHNNESKQKLKHGRNNNSKSQESEHTDMYRHVWWQLPKHRALLHTLLLHNILMFAGTFCPAWDCPSRSCFSSCSSCTAQAKQSHRHEHNNPQRILKQWKIQVNMPNGMTT